nr:MAG TPA: hypothetical protein [Caudoviricetes sp.]
MVLVCLVYLIRYARARIFYFVVLFRWINRNVLYTRF